MFYHRPVVSYRVSYLGSVDEQALSSFGHSGSLLDMPVMDEQRQWRLALRNGLRTTT